MFKRTALLFAMGVLAVVFQSLTAEPVSAHSVSVTASASCVDDAPVISYTVTSWDLSTTAGSNTEVDVNFNGSKVDAQAFTIATNPKNQFSGQKPAPATPSVVVQAIAVGTWVGDPAFPSGQNASVTVDIPTDCGPSGTGRFTGGTKDIVVAGLTLNALATDSKGRGITTGLTIHCDLLLSNNLEVNWPGHHFHMEEHMRTIACTDSPSILQKPPSAPLDTLIGVGTGRYDGTDGFTIEFTLVDGGEPGTDDMIALKIYETGANPPNVVLDFPLTLLTAGNLQAHFDQPHKEKP